MALKRWTLTIMLMMPLHLLGQMQYAVEQWLQDDGNETAAADLTDLLADFADNPLNINDPDALNQLPFFSPFQIRALKNYIFLHGELLSIKELHYVPGFDSTTVALISPYIKAEHLRKPLQQELHKGHHSLTSGIGGTMEQADGYRNGHYAGDNLHALLCYSYNLQNKVQVRVAADKDPTEAWGKENFYNYHLMLSDMGRMEKLIAGRYNLQFGQGLTLWTGMAPFDITGRVPERFGNGIRPTSAFNEEDCQEGLAATVRLIEGIRLAGFASYREGETMAGGHAEWRYKNLIVGTTAAHTRWKDSIVPRSYAYNANAFRGNAQTHFGIDGAWQYGHVLVYGEAAVSNEGKLAAIAGAALTAGDNHIGLSLRHYDPRYHNLHAKGYGFGNTQGEQGLRLDIRSPLPLGIQALLSADLHRFPSLRYASYSPSDGATLRAQLTRSLGSRSTAFLRYSYRQKQRNIPNFDSSLYASEQTVRQQLQAETKTTFGNWTLSTRIMATEFDTENDPPRRGWLAALSARYEAGAWKATASTAYFRSDNYDTRFYLSESNIQYAWSMPALYGKGMRGYLLLQYMPVKGLTLSAKYSMLLHPGAENIGSGNSRTTGPLRQTWHTQIRWNF